MKIEPSPYTVLIDTREQLKFSFAHPFKSGNKLYSIQTEIGTIKSGDYSLKGYENEISVERKSLKDLFGTLGQGRSRFIRELERLAEMKFAAVVVEADWTTILTNPPSRSRLKPVTIVHSVLAWQQRYRGIHWWFLPDRDLAEVITLRVLDRYWRDGLMKIPFSVSSTIAITNNPTPTQIAGASAN